MISPQIPKGFRDFLPDKMNLRRKVIETMSKIFRSFGFEEFDTPCLEYAQTLEGKYGEDGEKLIYKFEDRGGRMLAMRYDLTIPLCRAIAMHHKIVKPFKRFQIAPVWRADKPQRGRFREFYQCDIDVIGSESVYHDAELLIITHTVLTELGFSNFIMRINNRKILNCLSTKAGIEPEDISSFLRSIDKVDKAGADGVVKELKEKKLLSSPSSYRVLDFLLDDKVSFNDLSALINRNDTGYEGVEELEKIFNTLVSYGIPESNYCFDLTLARGLDYYTGPIFETTVTEPVIGSITGGGRYDNIISLFTKNGMPATGTSFGLERIVTVMEELNGQTANTTTTDVLITLFDSSMMGNCLAAAKILRQAGINTEVYLSEDKLKKQLSYASNRSIPIVALLGPDEAKANSITVKNMTDGTQQTVALEKSVAYIKNITGTFYELRRIDNKTTKRG